VMRRGAADAGGPSRSLPYDCVSQKKSWFAPLPPAQVSLFGVESGAGPRGRLLPPLAAFHALPSRFRRMTRMR
jgi:hypothetical protein